MLCVCGEGGLVAIPSILSRPFATIESPSHVPRSRRITEVHSPGDLPRGSTARGSSEKKKKQKIELGNNSYYDTIKKKLMTKKGGTYREKSPHNNR